MTGADPNRDPAYASSLLRRAKALQSEADEVLRTLDARDFCDILLGT